jgi:chaperone required for assembly of F1-ATPase
MRDILEEALSEAFDPVKTAQRAMRAALSKRFYKTVEVAEKPGGFAVLLDNKPVRTPARNDLLLPTAKSAFIVAGEFDAQETEVNPAAMPATRIANTALDGVASEPQAVFEDILKFAASDLLCYRAETPAALIERQAAKWDPVLDWLRDDLGANFILAQGIVHVTQPREAIALLGATLRRHDDPLSLACIHTITSLTGSALLATALAQQFLVPGDVWDAAHVDEDWNIEQWGEDLEAMDRRKLRKAEFDAASAMLDALR